MQVGTGPLEWDAVRAVDVNSPQTNDDDLDALADLLPVNICEQTPAAPAMHQLPMLARVT